MARLIDADELLKHKTDHEMISTHLIYNAPTVDAQPVIHCRDCKWWKDKDGVYRRGIGAESKCPINRREVMEGMGYCFMFEPQESEDKE